MHYAKTAGESRITRMQAQPLGWRGGFQERGSGERERPPRSLLDDDDSGRGGNERDRARGGRCDGRRACARIAWDAAPAPATSASASSVVPCDVTTAKRRMCRRECTNMYVQYTQT